MKHFCLNMIVKNEAARLVRALDSALPAISTFAILDTGSTDDTVAVIEAWALKNNIRGIVGSVSFFDFSQARNQALDFARNWHENEQAPYFDYLMLMDADMELVVTDPMALDGINDIALHMIQKAGGVSYHNTRLLSTLSDAQYQGVTHEYLDVMAADQPLAGAHFIDHADGANRPDKFTRDIKLLRKDLERDGKNPRTWFYLANSYRDNGDYAQAAAAYRMRIQIGGWEEETWNSQVHLAGCLKAQGLEDAFLKEMLVAYNMRPRRAEPLHDLAKHYREKGMNAAAMLFIEMGLATERPDDLLFMADWVYEWGFREEFSISGYYDEKTRENAFRVTNGLALDPKVPEHVRRGARTNMVFYLPKLQQSCPSITYTQLELRNNPGFTAMNPSVTLTPSGKLEVLIRTVNYKMDEQGRYMIGPKECGDAPIVTENWLVELSPNLQARNCVLVNWDRPAPKFDLVVGLEDMRIFWHNSQRKFVACVREQSEYGTCEQWQGILSTRTGEANVEDAVRISDGTQTEKNWAPFILDKNLLYLYRLDTVRFADGKLQKIEGCNLSVDNISGSSQWVRVRGGNLAVVHEAISHPTTGKRVYQHRFAFYHPDMHSLMLSKPFVFRDVQIEFCAGLARHPDGKQLVISFGERDEKAWLATVAEQEIFNLLYGARL